MPSSSAMRGSLFLLLVLVVTGCADQVRGGAGPGPSPSGGDAAVVAVTDGGATGDGGGVLEPPPALVYAHSGTSLYSIDPDTFFVTLIGPFAWPSGSDEMTDIALDKSGNMVGISFTRIYAIDKTTASCTSLSTFSGGLLNGLSFIAADQVDANGAEILVGAASDGNLYQIDPTTGTQTLLGNYGDGWGSSGDIVSVAGATYATAYDGFASNDMLVTLNPKTGVATTVGLTGTDRIWGLGYWKQKLFGFTETKGMVSINITTGVATPVAGGNNIKWYGAGVTTAAPTTVQ